MEVLEDLVIAITATKLSNSKWTATSIQADKYRHRWRLVRCGGLGCCGDAVREGSIAIHGLSNQYTQADEGSRCPLVGRRAYRELMMASKLRGASCGLSPLI